MDVKFREATIRDYDGVKKISKGIYGNTDTLVYSFVDWAKSDEWFLFVGEVNHNRIVAFIAAQVTDGAKSLNLRCARVDKAYRGCGLYKALLSYVARYTMGKVRGVKFLYRIQPTEVRVPNGYDIIKKIGLVTMFLDDYASVYFEKNDFGQSNMQVITWLKLKALYDGNDEVKDLFCKSSLEIYCDIFNLNCMANWKLLMGRVNTRVMLTQHECRNGKAEIVISILRLEKYFTSEGVPMAAMNVYGLNKSGLKCHIAKGILEAVKHIGGGRYLMEIYTKTEAFMDCVNFVKDIPGCYVNFHGESNLIVGDLSKNLEDIALIKCSL